MMEIKVKWGKETLTMEVEPSSTLLVLKQHIAARTAVPVEKQKIMGLKSTRDEGVLTEIGLVAGKTIMLIGTAEGTVVPTVLAAEAVAAEEATSGSATNEMPKGLRNIANTCYFNAAIQMLRTMPEIKEILAEYKGTDALMVQLGRLLNQLDSNSTTEVVPAAMWTALMQEFPNFAERDEHGGFMQHDAQEVVNVLLQEMVSILPKKYMHLFMGNMRHQKTCPEDPEDVMKEDFSPFSMLGCNIAGEAQTLEAGLESSFKEQFSIHNERLGKEAGITRTTLVSTLPEYLFVHMERFAWKSDIQKKAKILKPISFPIVLDTAIVMTDELKQSVKAEREVIMARRDKEVERRKRGRFESKEAEEEAPPVENVPTELHNESGFYELCSVVSHKGRSAEGGHYVCWTKRNEQWFVIDDHNVAAVTEEDVKRLRGVGEAHIAYVLLYRSRNPITHKPVVPS